MQQVLVQAQSKGERKLSPLKKCAFLILPIGMDGKGREQAANCVQLIEFISQMW
jgi:hypothetical protein